MIKRFEDRHIGNNANGETTMLDELSFSSLDELIDNIVPQSIRLDQALKLPEAQSEFDAINEVRQIMDQNIESDTFIGLGYSQTITPPVIGRNILENPGWYTQYTPYQAEISQGRLEALLNFQTVICDLTAMDVSNASLLDSATAAAEAMMLLYRVRPKEKKNAHTFYVSETCFPHVIEVLMGRAKPLGIIVELVCPFEMSLNDAVFGMMLQYPNGQGSVCDYQDVVEKCHSSKVLVSVYTDLLALSILKPPGEFGADVVFGSSQRFGVPMGYGGPYAAFISTKEDYKRQLPGRIIGVSVDRHGNPAYRMALQTREQHIRREKATSNICTAQALLAIMAGMYAVYHGSDGLENIAKTIMKKAVFLSERFKEMGLELLNNTLFDTVAIKTGDLTDSLIKKAEAQHILIRKINNDTIGISVDECTNQDQINRVIKLFGSYENGNSSYHSSDISAYLINKRDSVFLTHEVFSSYRSETEMLRYLKRLENKDLSLTSSMIPLGSCTMKLNATTEMIPISWSSSANIHPFSPLPFAVGYQEIISRLESYLSVITGFSAVSLQPNSGAQGEYAGLLVMRAYHHSNTDKDRNVILIPSSAHGTNPASAALAGLKVVIIKCDDDGNIDQEDLKLKCTLYKDQLFGLMITYPSTHGVYETGIESICALIHQYGGLVYMDGANMNAQVGLTTPFAIGADVCHLNLHKTFSVPHGGGGPGMGPICVVDKLAAFLPSHPLVETGGESGISSISGAPWGSASILLISYLYIRMMGSIGLLNATKAAILNANYIASKLSKYYPVLYKGKNGYVAHELIIDCRHFKKSHGIEVEDIAKRLIDYGFHAPTMSWPVAGTMMIEPTESESIGELDRFCDAMIMIYSEIMDGNELLLKNAPHTSLELCSEKWDYPYSRKQASYPVEGLEQNKYWSPVARIDNVYGDRNLICSCPSVMEYASS